MYCMPLNDIITGSNEGTSHYLSMLLTDKQTTDIYIEEHAAIFRPGSLLCNSGKLVFISVVSTTDCRQLSRGSRELCSHSISLPLDSRQEIYIIEK